MGSLCYACVLIPRFTRVFASWISRFRRLFIIIHTSKAGGIKDRTPPPPGYYDQCVTLFRKNDVRSGGTENRPRSYDKAHDLNNATES